MLGTDACVSFLTSLSLGFIIGQVQVVIMPTLEGFFWGFIGMTHIKGFAHGKYSRKRNYCCDRDSSKHLEARKALGG